MVEQIYARRIEKELFYPNGRQRIAYIGLIDGRGTNLYMLDTGDTEYFKYADYNEKLIQADASIRSNNRQLTDTVIELEGVLHDNERLFQVLDRLLIISQEMYETTTFAYGEKTRFCELLGNIRRDYRTLKARIQGYPGGEGHEKD